MAEIASKKNPPAKAKNPPQQKKGNAKRGKSRNDRELRKILSTSTTLSYDQLRDLCTVASTSHAWEGWAAFQWGDLGYFIWLLSSKMERQIDFTQCTPGNIGAYFAACFGWFIKKCGNWQNADDDIPSCGNFKIPKGLALLFKQCSVYKTSNGVQLYTAITIDGDNWNRQNIPNWPLGGRPDFTGVEPVGVVDTSTTSPLETDLAMVSSIIEEVFNDSVTVNSVPCRADSPELFVGDQGSSLFKSFPWSQVMALSANQDFFLGNIMSQRTDFQYKFFLWEILFCFHHNAKTFAKVLRSNDYHPMMIDLKTNVVNAAYAAQIMSFVFNIADATVNSSELYMWIMLCWSYYASYLPLVSICSDLRLLPNYKLKGLKMPFSLQFIAKQNSLKIGSTFFYIDPSTIVLAWSSYFKTANTSSFSKYSLNNAGFTSDDVPGDVLVAPGVTWNGPSPALGFKFSWNYVQKTYDYMRSHPYLWNMATAKETMLRDCGCFADIGITPGSDNYTNAVLGTLSPQGVNKLYCGSLLSNGMCKLACALTVRQATTATDISYTHIHTKFRVKSTLTNADTIKIIDYTMNPGLTSIATIQAAVNKNSVTGYVMDAVSEGTLPYNISKDALRKWLMDLAANSSVVHAVTDAGKKAILDSAPDQITGEWVANAVGSLGMSGLGVLATFLAGKMIYFARGRTVDEL